MKIAVVAPLVAPIGGAEPYGNHALLIDVASGLARRGHRVRLYAAEGSDVPDVELVPCAVDAAARGAFIHADRAHAPSAAMRASFTRLFRRLRADGPEVVSQHAFDAEAIELAAGLPALHTLHMPPIVPALVRACRETNAPLVGVSQFAAAQWRDAVGRDVLTIANGVPDFVPLATLVQPVALIAGRICREKGVATGIRAALAAGLRVHLVGSVYDPVYFQREVAPLLGARVRMQACLPRRELWQVMAQSAVCLMPIEWDEPYGLVAAEAQVAGCPVVGYARGALPEVLAEGVSGILVPAAERQALSAAIRRALTLDRRAVRESARARLLIGPMLDRYESELTAIAERHRPPRASVIPHPALRSTV
jgi:glycosyltransferase involved in cell wall biosynthesis